MATVNCCQGNLHEGTPRGREDNLHDLPCYVTLPAGTEAVKGTIVIVPDGYGWTFKNLRILADIYADRVGARVLLPDFMNGAAMDPAIMKSTNVITSKSAWFFQKIIPAMSAVAYMVPFMFFNRLSVTYPRVKAFLSALRKDSELPIGVAGFCWGGQHVMTLAQGKGTMDDKPLVDVLYTAHPSHFDLAGAAKDVQVPLAISEGTKDMIVGMDVVRKVQEVFEAKNKDLEDPMFEVKVVEGAKHGFAARCDMDSPEEAAQEQIAETHAVEWFAHWFAKR